MNPRIRTRILKIIAMALVYGVATRLTTIIWTL